MANEKVLSHTDRIIAGEIVKEIIETEAAPKPVGPYSQAIKAGKFLFVSGQLAIDPKQNKLIVSDIKGQTARVLENIKAILEAAHFSLEDVVQTNVYLSTLTLFKDFNDIYSKYFFGNFPTRATIEGVLMPGALVEISAIAFKE
jgi:2-iminobutanoate/2-iminopropanoate deaminase